MHFLTKLLRPIVHARPIHNSAIRYAITNLEMPAMSPTMTEGGIANWKKKEGETFSAGDVLLEIETDKATIDVEAQEDGIVGKIVLPDGSKNIPVGRVIAILAEEGDDLSNLRVPQQSTAEPKKSSSSTASSPAPLASAPAPSPPAAATAFRHGSSSYHQPLFPSVHKLLLEHGITDPGSIPATGVRGRLTKGDVLTFLGKASGPTGTYTEKRAVLHSNTGAVAAGKAGQAKQEIKTLDGPALRRIIVGNMLANSLKTRVPILEPIPADFDSIIADYLPLSSLSSASKAAAAASPGPVIPPPPKSASVSASEYLEGLV